MRYHIIIPGRPVPKGRPRLGKNGNVYTPRKTREYETFVGWKTREVIKEPLVGDVAMDIKVYIKSQCGDLDNLEKAILDGMNGIAYKDDKQVTVLAIRRLRDKSERVEIELWEVAE
ncbi:RusA family crossover junction endodeoxyribonuclease [Mahella australiensis]|uniref:Endodeoxyribonuclease RusA n=1 Tax=Mahella australiensis (strain DSM 15567 / CIP 107919 / 50-1 BON) TaxID=697281 RepID=F4A0W5_MAHA5|nr:RusA family crossover junction endodeoxyribonuclease [Mahella australiensis]AEE98042.1 endodeoxyribonuclease RusA [Mahella australiensis 50-1 BON]